MGKAIISEYPYIHTIRYMGNKSKLLNFIMPFIESVTNPGDTICDLMCGTSTIGYALSKRNRVIANDFEYYSFVIAKTLLCNKSILSIEEAHKQIDYFYLENMKNKKWSFFYDTYKDTYFSPKQCLQIDSLRFAIEHNKNSYYYFYLTCLMSAMCKGQSTTGHFAQFLKKDSLRVQTLRGLDIYNLFFEKISAFSIFSPPTYENLVFNLDYKDLLKNTDLLKNVSCFYLDSPYTSDQYSRFYHILETVCLYDNPKTEFKAKYRVNRKQSGFCYKKTVLDEFESIIKYASNNNSSLIISYSNHGVTTVDSILVLGKKYYNKCNVYWRPYIHSSQGKGSLNIRECVLVLSN